MPQRIPRIAGLLLAAAMGTATAQAQAQASSAHASLAQLNFQLFDLDLSDGITPAMNITATQTWSQSFYGTLTTPIEDHTIYAAGSSSVSRAFGQAATSGGAAPWTSAASYTDAAPGDIYFKSYNLYQIQFTLTPSTGLLVTADASVDASDAGGGSEASSLAFINGWLNAELPYNYLGDGAYAYDTSLSRTLRGQMQSGAVALTGGLHVVTEAVAQLAPVPEPASVAMLLTGLAVVGAGVRRRGGKEAARRKALGRAAS